MLPLLYIGYKISNPWLESDGTTYGIHPTGLGLNGRTHPSGMERGGVRKEKKGKHERRVRTRGWQGHGQI